MSMKQREEQALLRTIDLLSEGELRGSSRGQNYTVRRKRRTKRGRCLQGVSAVE